MASGRFRFDRFELDAADRQLLRDGQPLDLNSRYLDALALLVSEPGRLVSKDRFMGEVWRGVPVTDEALTQCIRTLRRQLGDDAGRPRFIETVPKHGYRFIAPVDGTAAPAVRAASAASGRHEILIGAAGTVGGGFAGFAGGLIYGFAGASGPAEQGVGTISVLLVILCVTIAVAVIGGAGVSFGIAIGSRLVRSWWGRVIGGALGGLIVGGGVKLLGLDAFTLLFGHAPAGMTGALEGTILGAAVGLASWLAFRAGVARLRRSVLVAAAVGAAAGILIALVGGRLMLGSLDLLARTFPDSRLRLEPISGLFGEPGLGLVTRVATCALEGGLFSACVVAAMILGQRSIGSSAEARTGVRGGEAAAEV